MKTFIVFGFDMGSNSIGWCVMIVDDNGMPVKILAMGSRIFDNSRDSKTNVPLSVEKRLVHSASVRRDRQLMRTRNLCKLLRKYGLLPTDENERIANRDPYRLRMLAVHRKIDLWGIGRVLLHINKRRGFKSNARLDKTADVSELSGMKAGISKLHELIGNRTLGEFLYERKKNGKSVRMRANTIKNKNEYEIYADRKMYEDELRRIWDTQQKYHSILTEEMYGKISNAIFSQRPLKVPERGYCLFEVGRRRAYKAYPIFQKMRIYQEVNALEIVDIGDSSDNLSKSDKKKLAEALLENSPKLVNKKHIATFAKIKKFLGISNSVKFNFENETRGGFYADLSSPVLDSAFGERYNSVSDTVKERLIDAVMADDMKSFSDICKEQLGMNLNEAEKAFNKCYDLPDGTGSLSSVAIHKILPFLEDGSLYHNACARAGYDFNNSFYKGNKLDALPYYGAVLHTAVLGGNAKFDAETAPEKHFGKINNPTVHVALNQLRKLYNKLTEVYGKPDRISIESARELPLGERGLSDIISEQKKNRKDNERIAEELKRLGEANTEWNRTKYKLWEDLNKDPTKRMCPFCGRQIPPSRIFSSEFEIEHLLPFSQTFDDTRANKVLSCCSCNRVHKGQHTPYDSFAHRVGYNWTEILARVTELPISKQWRFRQDAMEFFNEKYGDFIARMLNDTRYMSKVARQYLSAVIEPQNIFTVPGRITALLRGKWGLNSILDDKSSESEVKKNRNDNRHHAVDAFVVSCVNRKLLLKISESAKLSEEAHLERILKNIPTPFEHITFEELKNTVLAINVSHKLDRGNAKRAIKNGGTVAKLHNDTALGKIGSEKNGKITLAKRVPILSIKYDRDSIMQIANNKIRTDLLALYDDVAANLMEKKEQEKIWNDLLSGYCSSNKIRRVRIHKNNNEISKLIPICDKNGRVYKYMENAESYCMDIYKSKSEEWKFEVINMYAAHRNVIPNWRKNDPHAKLVMRLFKRDTIAYEENGIYKLAIVKGLATHGQISLLPLHVGKIDGNPPKKLPSVLQRLNAHKVYVDEIGRVYDSHKNE